MIGEMHLKRPENQSFLSFFQTAAGYVTHLQRKVLESQ